MRFVREIEDEEERNNVFKSLKMKLGDVGLNSNTDDEQYVAQVVGFLQEFEWGGRYSRSVQFISSHLETLEAITP